MEFEKKPARSRAKLDPALKEAAGRGMDISKPGNQMLLRRLGQAQEGSPELEQVIKGRLREMYSSSQIPAAEREADRIASSVSGARTPEEVKSVLGEKLGADFSGVQFHVGAEASERAGNLGALAYTTGSDVYFKGGFDPMTAAHELVHTVQQGAVESAVPTTSVPLGSVQMKRDGSGGGFFGWLKKLTGKGGGAPQGGVPAGLDLTGAAQSESLKGKAVTSMPTVTGERAVVKAGTNPHVEAALADFYNVANAVRSVDHPSAWQFGAPEARALLESEREGVGQLFQQGKLANPSSRQPSLQRQLEGTTVFRMVGGQSARDPGDDPAQREKAYGELLETMYDGPDLQDYQQTMGYIALLDFIAGNNDRHANINFNNWMEERDKKKIHLIDNDPVGSPGSHGFGEGNLAAAQSGWLTNARFMFGANSPGGPSMRNFFDNWLGATSSQASYPYLFGENGRAGFAGVSQAIGDLPALRAALEARFQQQARAGQVSDERAQVNRAILERFDMLQDILNPIPQKPTRRAPRPMQGMPQMPSRPAPMPPAIGRHRRRP